MIFAGFLTCGYTAERLSIYVAFGSHQLKLFDERGMPIGEWSYAGLRCIDAVYWGQSVRLSHCDYGEKCLTIEDRRFRPFLCKAVPRLRGWQRTRHSTIMRLLCCGIAVAVTALGLLWAVPHFADRVAHIVPRQWEEAFGRHITENFVRHAPVCRGVAGQAALEMLTERLMAPNQTHIPFKVEVRKSQVINAFALPGGHVVLFNGLVRAARSPEEVAGVLAHEMAHQIQRHPLRGLVRSMGLRLVRGVVMGGFSLTTASGVHLGETLLSLSYNREDENEADRIGVAMLNSANIRGDGLVEFFTRYQTEGKETASHLKRESLTQEHLMSFLSTHPPGQKRVATIRSQIRGQQDALTKEQWKALQEICEESPREK